MTFRFERSRVRAEYQEDIKSIVVTLTHTDKACFTPVLLRQTLDLTRAIDESYPTFKPEYVVVTSTTAPKTFSLGGDIEYFLECVEDYRSHDLTLYAQMCIEIAWWLYNPNRPFMTVAIADGDALGGGFELSLACDHMYALSTAKYGFPEASFGIFPGMGGWSFGTRKLGYELSVKMIERGLLLNGFDLYDRGVAHEVRGSNLFNAFRQHQATTFFPQVHAISLAKKMADHISFEELQRIVDVWVKNCMSLKPEHFRRMRAIANVQTKKRNIL